jgi:phage baseplate assembly protein gpV
VQEEIIMSIIENMKVVAQKEIKKLRMPELGIITSVFPHSGAADKDNYECNLRLKNRNIELRRVQIATQSIGLVSPPAVGDLVLVEFINGDINAPIVIGRLYNEKDRPPVNKLEEIVYIPAYKENSGVRRIYLEFPGGMNIKITDAEVTVNAGDTRVIVQRSGDVVVEAKGNINVKSKGDTLIKSDGDLSISASNIKINSEKELSIKSGKDMKLVSDSKTEIKSTSQMNVEASADMTIKGQMVKIN